MFLNLSRFASCNWIPNLNRASKRRLLHEVHYEAIQKEFLVFEPMNLVVRFVNSFVRLRDYFINNCEAERCVRVVGHNWGLENT